MALFPDGKSTEFEPTNMKRIKIKVDSPEIKGSSIPLGQVFTGHIDGNTDWIFMKIEMKENVPVIISLSCGVYGHYWDDPPIQNYQPIEFEKG